MNYYNEIDPYCVAWLQSLVEAAFIPDGHVDSRSICEVTAGDVKGYTQCHFFAGIGGWSLALRLAGWPEDRPIWTGSCPCQPFSVAGQGKGTDDARHLWPDFYRLIRSRRPDVVMGEQVSGRAGYSWLDGVRADLEAEGYSCGAVDIPACSIGAPHIRNRLYWVADTSGELPAEDRVTGEQEAPGQRRAEPGNRGEAVRLGDTHHAGLQRRWLNPCEHAGQLPARETGDWDDFDIVECTDGKARRIEPGTFPLAYGVPARVGKLRGYGNSIVPQLAAEVIKAYVNA